MVQTARLTYDIQRVRALQPCEGGTLVLFQNGRSGCVPAGHPESADFLGHATNSLHYGEPVGIIVSDAGDMIEVNAAHQSTVHYVRPDDEDPNRIMVAFWAYSPICYLCKPHPDFDRIHTLLQRAVLSGEQILLANHKDMIEGETETWWQLLDVRPLA